MAKAYNIEVKNGQRKTYEYRAHLHYMGMKWIARDHQWVMRTSDEAQVNSIIRFADDNKLICIVYDDQHGRNRNYRMNFFEKNAPMFGNYYICAYCFKPIRHKDVTVDHIIPVKKAKANRIANRLMERLDIRDVNEEKNLCACCHECNSRKGSKGGLWIIRGFLGKKKRFVIAVYILFISAIMAVLGIASYYGLVVRS